MKIEETLDELGIPYQPGGSHRHVSTGWVGISPCPSCGSEEYHCGINLTYGAIVCWHCGKLNLVDTLAQLSGRSWQEVKKLLGEWQREEKEDKPRGKLVIPAGVDSLGKAHRIYLKRRGFDSEQLERLWGLQGIGLASRLSWRVFIPIQQGGRIVSWTTRSIRESAYIRYISASPEEEEVSHKSLLLGEDYCRHSIIVVEGPSGVWRLGPGTVCTFGIDYTRAQVLRIARYPVRTIAFDPEPRAQEQAAKLCCELSAMPGITRRIEVDCEDPGVLPEHDVELLRKSFLR